VVVDSCSIEKEMGTAGCRVNIPFEVMIVIGITIMDEGRDIEESS